jgi:hypothetical protein
VCRGRLRRPSGSRIGLKEGIRHVVLGKIMPVILASIFVILKYVDRALLRDSEIVRSSPANEPECRNEENSSAYHAAWKMKNK